MIVPLAELVLPPDCHVLPDAESIGKAVVMHPMK